jgi:hypothetical protein
MSWCFKMDLPRLLLLWRKRQVIPHKVLAYLTESFITNNYYMLSNSAPIIVWLLSFSFLMLYTTLIHFYILNKPCIPRIDLTWLLNIILFMYDRFNMLIFWRFFAPQFMRDVQHNFLYFYPALPLFFSPFLPLSFLFSSLPFFPFFPSFIPPFLVILAW